VLVNRRWHGLAVYWRLWRAHYLARFPSSPLPPQFYRSWPLPPPPLLHSPSHLPQLVLPVARPQRAQQPPSGSALCAIADCGQTDASRAWCTGTYGSKDCHRHCEGSGANGVAAPLITETAVGGRVVEWRDELVSNARRVHERWMTNQKRLLWSTNELVQSLRCPITY
jgi:hypothetical protein